MTKLLLIPLMLTGCASVSAAPRSKDPPARVDYQGFADLTDEAGAYRSQRLVPIEEFMKLAREQNTIILDARSESAFARKHIKGAININFSDFSYERLAREIPDKNTRILIYCNNNIDADTRNFPTKSVDLALNIPTFINLYGYGYRNIYELSTLLAADDPRLIFEGSDVEPAADAG